MRYVNAEPVEVLVLRILVPRSGTYLP